MWTTGMRKIWYPANKVVVVAPNPRPGCCCDPAVVACANELPRERARIGMRIRNSMSKDENPQSSATAPNGTRKKAKLEARCKRRITLPSYGTTYPISEFLSHPSGLEAMLNTRALQNFECLDSHTYRCTLHTIQFMKFEVVPVVDLRLTYTTNGCAVEMLSCKFEGSEALKQQNGLFSAFMRNDITWEENSSEPCLDFDVQLGLTLQVFTKPFTLLPLSAVETPGNLIMQGLIDRLVPLLIQQLLEDYQAWVAEKSKLPE